MTPEEEEIQNYLKNLGYEIDRVLLRYDRGEQGMSQDFQELKKSSLVYSYYEQLTFKLEKMLQHYDQEMWQPKD